MTRDFLLPIALLVLHARALAATGDARTLHLISTPAGATVYEKGAELGTTPMDYTYTGNGESVTLEFRYSGFAPATVQVKVEEAAGQLFASAMLLNIPHFLGVGKNTPYHFTRNEVHVTLYREPDTDARKVELPMLVMRSLITASTPVGSLDSKRLVGSSAELPDMDAPDALTGALVSGMARSWADTRIARPGTKTGDELLQRAKITLTPVLTAIDLQLNEEDDLFYGPVNTTLRWEVRSALDRDSLLFELEQGGRYEVFGANKYDVLGLVMRDAAHRFLDEPGLADRLVALVHSGLQRSKGASVQLKTPEPIPFTGRKDMIGELVKGVVTIETDGGHGSGFLITNDGYLITNAHVVGDAATVKVKFQQGFKLDGTVVKVNRDFDVALVKVSGDDLPALVIGDDKALQLGEELFAIGTPLDEELGQTVTRGIMSGRRTFDEHEFIQTDVPINPGNSGGPLIDENGKVVGVATMKVQGGKVEGIGFGVPMTTVVEMLHITWLP